MALTASRHGEVRDGRPGVTPGGSKGTFNAAVQRVTALRSGLF
jgi:hypothetical protein